MRKPVLQTRCVGQATHYSGHPMAPPEYVFECEEPAKPPLTLGYVLKVALIAGWFFFASGYTIVAIGDRLTG